LTERPWLDVRVERLSDVGKPIVELLGDVKQAEKMLKENDTQYLRRCYVRALFTGIEGTIYTLKQAVVGIAAASGPPGYDILRVLSVPEVAMLQEYSIDMASNGKPIISQKFIRLPDNIKFTVNIISKLCDYAIDLDVKGIEWETFMEAIQIRHRITHPKIIEEFQITDDEIKLMRDVSSWFIKFTKNSLLAIKAGMERELMHFPWPPPGFLALDDAPNHLKS
jgi:hypothetical protein